MVRRYSIEDRELKDLLVAAIKDFAVPGAQLGLLTDTGEGESIRAQTVCAGSISTYTGYRVQPDTLFQIGSISKIWTTVLAMQLVDEGLLDLGATVKEVLPEFSIHMAPDITFNCTVRQLMNHTSGIEGDAFPDLGRDDDCVARYVRYLADFPPRTPLGGPLSYSNGAFVVLGRIIEKLRGVTWDTALRRYIAKPAGLDHVWTLPEDVLRFSSALGHIRAVDAGQRLFPAPIEPSGVWQLPRCTGPCGSVSASMKDLLSFVSIFLNHGIAPNGTRLLSDRSCSMMIEQSVDIRAQGVENLGWGLGWQLPNWGDTPAFGHGGATEGQRAAVVVFPERRCAIGVLTNAYSGSAMAASLTADIAGRLGLGEHRTATIDNRHIDEHEAGRVCGSYRRFNTEFSFAAQGPTGLQAVFEPDPDDGPYAARITLPVYPTAEGYYAVRFPGDRGVTELAFLPTGEGGMYAAMDHRITPRVEAA